MKQANQAVWINKDGSLLVAASDPTAAFLLAANGQYVADGDVASYPNASAFFADVSGQEIRMSQMAGGPIVAVRPTAGGGGGGGGGWAKTVTVVTHAQMLALATVYVPVIPVQPAGTCILIQQVVFKISDPWVAYTGLGTPDPESDAASSVLGLCTQDWGADASGYIDAWKLLGRNSNPGKFYFGRVGPTYQVQAANVRWPKSLFGQVLFSDDGHGGPIFVGMANPAAGPVAGGSPNNILTIDTYYSLETFS